MNTSRTALITGASRGLGRALALALAERGWRLLLTARTAAHLAVLAEALGPGAEMVTCAGDVADAAHRAELARLVTDWGSLDLLVNNASTLGPTPLRPLAELSTDDLQHILEVNVLAPHALTREVLPTLEAAGGAVIDISSDAAVEHYETWGGYGAAKAALDHLTGTLAVEHPGVRAYALDPGDMRTGMQQAAFPGDDISDRPLPEQVAVPAVLALLDQRPPSGRYTASGLVGAAPATGAAS